LLVFDRAFEFACSPQEAVVTAALAVTLAFAVAIAWIALVVDLTREQAILATVCRVAKTLCCVDAVIIWTDFTLAMTRTDSACDYTSTFVLATVSQETIFTRARCFACRDHASTISRTDEARWILWTLQLTCFPTTFRSTDTARSTQFANTALAKA